MSTDYASLGISSTATSTTPKATSTGTKTTLDQSDFLSLMTAQLKNQDPFNPVDNTQMVAQMAQFSSVAGISQMNTTLSSIATKLGATSVNDATSYVGKTVLTAGTTAYPRTSGGFAGQIELAKDATNVNVTISDQDGQPLKTLQLGAQKAGTVSYDWDGTTDSGDAAGSGPFKVGIYASNGSTGVSANSLVWAPVESVSLPSGGTPVLNVTGLGQVNLSDIRSVA